MRLPFSLQAATLILLAGLLTGCREPATSLTASAETVDTGETISQPTHNSTAPDEPAVLDEPVILDNVVLDKANKLVQSSPPERTAPHGQDDEPYIEELNSGRYCYRLATNTSDEVIRLDVASDRTISGDATATIANEDLGYYTSYERKFAGSLDATQVNLNLTTWIEYDVQQEQQIWTVTPQQLRTQREQFPAIDCAAVQARFTHDSGLEATDLTDSAIAVHRDRIQFSPGRSSTTIENSVIRGERDLYLIGAQGGQMMNLSITSLENNAVFDVVTPSGIILSTEAEQAELLLPHTGDYEVIVGGTRGNASYALNVEIR